MLKPIFVAAACILVLMIVLKDGRLLRTTGLTGSCSTVATNPGNGGVVEACKPGKLEGRPDLTKRSCVSAGFKDGLQYWRCPSEVASSNAGR